MEKEVRQRYMRWRRQTLAMAREIVALEKRFDSELNGITLPCGEKIRLASSISRYEKVRLMMQTKGFAESIPLSSCEYVTKMIDGYLKRKKLKITGNGT
jgi:hypothetical protein